MSERQNDSHEKQEEASPSQEGQEKHEKDSPPDQDRGHMQTQIQEQDKVHHGTQDSEDENSTRNELSARIPRVHFRSNQQETHQEKPQESEQQEESERANARKENLPHAPYSPYIHESADITDTPLNERQQHQQDAQGQDQRNTSDGDTETLKKKATNLAEHGAAKSLPQSTRDKLKSFGQSIRDKTRSLAALLGREEIGGDDTLPSAYHPDLSPGSEMPLGQIPAHPIHSEHKHKQQRDNSHAEASRLVRDITQDQSSQNRTRGQNHGRSSSSAASNSTSHQEQQQQENRQQQRQRKESSNQANSSGKEGIGSSGIRNRFGGNGILSQLMKLNQDHHGGNSTSRAGSPDGGRGRIMGHSNSASSSREGTPSPPSSASGLGTPKKAKLKWYKKEHQQPQNQSTSTLVGASANLSGVSTPAHTESVEAASRRRGKRQNRQARLEDEIRVTVHIAEIISRQRYIMQLCKALMKFGAPTHRLEEYMQMTARVLEVESQYLYFPGCMIMAFDDPATRTTEVKLVRVSQGVDLARLSDTHSVYKNVAHDVIGVEEAIQELDLIMKRNPRYNKWVLVMVYGLASAFVGPFAFSARPIDMPIIFLNGLILGMMRFVIAPNSALYSNIFEVAAAILTSFLSRAFGSIPRRPPRSRQHHQRQIEQHHQQQQQHQPRQQQQSPQPPPQYIFCFSAIAQSSIALILPGFLVLSGSLELQSHQIVAGSIRMVYAIIYSLFLGYGITVGTTIYGLMDGRASSDISCPMTDEGAFSNPYVARFPFVALMILSLNVANQGKWKQCPPMLLIGLAGYVVNYFVTRRLGSNSQVANTVGAFTIGVLGNLYSRLWHGHAATAILPGIFVLVPSGLAASGSIISGIANANEIRSNVSSTNRGGGSLAGAGGSSGGSGGGGGGSGGLPPNGSVYSLGFGMIQVAIGITVGLFIAALLVYPYGKRRSGLFSF